MILRLKFILNIAVIVLSFFVLPCSTFANQQTKPKTVLVVGGAGYIGSYVNKLLSQYGYETIVFDNLINGDARAVKYGTFVKGDLNNREDLRSVFEQYNIDAVMHFAAYTAVGESVENPSKYYENNVVNTLNLLDVMREYDVGVFIFSSTAAIYGTPQSDLIDEDHPKLPLSPYGRSKLMIEQILHDYDVAYDLRYSCLRYFNAAGGDPEGEIINYRTDQSNLIPVALRSLMTKNGMISIFGTDYDTHDGTGVRDYIHIHDLATAHILCMEKLIEGAPSSEYNLGNGKGFSVKEVLAAVESATGRKLNIVETSRRAGDPAICVADSAKAKRELGWEPEFTDIRQIVFDSWNTMYRKH